jgi:hypothetical protein
MSPRRVLTRSASFTLLVLISVGLGACDRTPPATGPWEFGASGDTATLTNDSGRVNLWCREREIDLVWQGISLNRGNQLDLLVGRQAVTLEAKGMGGVCYFKCIAGEGRWTDALSAALASGEPVGLRYGRRTVAPIQGLSPEMARDFLALCDRGPADG